ncbi:MAG: signal peptide peptidase SppA [bacterium]
MARRALRRALREAARDRRIERVQVRVGPLAGGHATLFELREALVAGRAAGLTIDVYLAWVDTRTLWLASAGSTVHVAPEALVLATGLSAEMTFFGPALEGAGVEVEVLAAGTFKSAMEPFARRGPSPANREAIDALLDDLHARLVADLAAARGRTTEDVIAAFEAGPLAPAALVERGLADAVTAEEAFFADDPTPIWAYDGPPRPVPRWRRRPRLAVVEVRGTIKDGAFEDPAPSGASIRAVCDSLERARKAKSVRGVLLHVDSPGGSATASERMWHAVRKLAAEKPVVVWMGDVAASGGYYLASAATAVVAAPGTLTGSIGVIMARVVADGLLSRLGLRRVRFQRGSHAGLLSPTRRLLPDEKAAFEQHIQATYQLFLDRVCAGRGREEAWLRPIAEGRVWTGSQALAHGLVDALGTEADALRLLAEKAGVDPEVREIKLIQPRRSLMSRLRPGALAPALEALEMLQAAEGASVLAWCPVRLTPR